MKTNPPPSKEWIKEKVSSRVYHHSEHIVRDLTCGRFSIGQLESVLLEGRLLETHYHPLRGTSFLLLGYPDGQTVHAAFAIDSDQNLILLYAYRPEGPEWVNDTTRKKRDHTMSNPIKKCFFCNSRIEPITVGNFDFRWDGDLYVIKKVPAGLCVQCGEKYISAESSQKIVTKIKNREWRGEDTVQVLEYDEKTE